MAYLNETGLAHFWAKLKGKFLPVTGGTVTGSLAVTGKLSVGGNAVADHVAESGTSGEWKYIKYTSGLALLWCNVHPASGRGGLRNAGRCREQFRCGARLERQDRPAGR